MPCHGFKILTISKYYDCILWFRAISDTQTKTLPSLLAVVPTDFRQSSSKRVKDVCIASTLLIVAKIFMERTPIFLDLRDGVRGNLEGGTSSHSTEDPVSV